MIRYEVGSSVTHPDKQEIGQRYVVVSTACDTTDVESGNDASELAAKMRLQACNYPMQNGAASAMRWQTAVEPSFGEKVKWWTSANPTMNFHFVADLQRSELTTRDEIRSTTDLIYSWEHGGHGRLASFYIVYFVEQSFRARAYGHINRMLAEVDLSSLTEWSMIALLRSSFAARSFLPAWPRLLCLVREKLDSQGKNSNRLLRGLNR